MLSRCLIPTVMLLLGLCAAGTVRAGAPPAPRPIAITIDDLPVASTGLHPGAADRQALTARLLALLHEHGIRATGFVVGRNILGPADDENLRRWLRAGHELGNHTWSHLDLSTVPADSFMGDAERCRSRLDALIRASGGQGVRFFRFPFLVEGERPDKLAALRAHLTRTGQRNAAVTIDTQDWSYEKPWVEAGRAGDSVAHARIGAAYQQALQLAVTHYEELGDALFERPTPQVLLLHANEIGAAQWDSLFTWLAATNHRFVALDSVLTDPAFDTPHSFTAAYGCSLWERLRAGRRQVAARDAVTALFRAQAEAWNRGDIDAFCAVYDDSALFISPTGLTRGREAVRERYKRRYPGAAAMGRLALDIVEIQPLMGREITLLGDAVPGRVQGISVAARWTLTFPPDPAAGTDGPAKPPATGHTLILLTPTPRGWIIMQDASM